MGLDPLARLEECGDPSFGVVVADNDLMRMLVKYASMTDDELQPFCGNKCAADYRAKAIQSLDLFWGLSGVYFRPTDFD